MDNTIARAGGGECNAGCAPIGCWRDAATNAGVRFRGAVCRRLGGKRGRRTGRVTTWSEEWQRHVEERQDRDSGVARWRSLTSLAS